ncbi:alpha/beta fold hydrolase [Sphingomonas lycopersici]|uniref:Alpha/beta hydrolase n=1 Tax=Sphingomonas lycopersici TaxID=2951807 RepID=A0AA41ZCQ5_9SPHN|nr:alpha/beta hydrolase [Sphingomonas lycopersici]MCW6530779.1 alpha/beta hydrolase [Sphingomonas lycopersici]MCW6536746.1 alpha/beta hydrolase [Sphingomonas lycopersici]
MRIPFIGSLLLTVALAFPGLAAGQSVRREKPTIILVHGAFAESSSWDDVVVRLARDGFHVVAAANPLRGVASDGAAISRIVKATEGPVVLVGHSYGGPVITEAAAGNGNVTALVYVAAFAPDVGESSSSLSGKFPGSTLESSLTSVALPGGDKDLYIQPEKFRAQFAADVPPSRAALMATSQRPIALSALAEPSRVASWKALPTYSIYGTADRNIPAAVMKFMAERAGARDTVAIAGASHAVMVSHPAEVAAMIEEAANAK